MDSQNEISWKDRTSISEANLQDYLFEAGSWERQNLLVNAYSVKPNIDTLNTSGFIQFLRDRVTHFAFSETEREEMAVPGIEVQERSDYKKDPRKNGMLGELILFVLVEAVLDMPIVSHKLSLKQEPVQEVKGSDGLFFGEFRGKPSLAIGEAKMYSRRTGGITDALKSIDRFYGPSGGAKKKHELNVASKTLSEDLSREETERVIEAMSPGPSNDRTIHPVFVGHEEDWLHEVQVDSSEPAELRAEIQQEIRDLGLESQIIDKIKSDYRELEKHWVIFFMIPLEDVDRFRAELQEAIYPHSSKHQ